MSNLSPDGVDAEAYLADARTQAAVERKFEIIGEAVNRLQKFRPDLAERIPEMRKIIDFCNILAHGYEHVVPELVRDYVQNHLPQPHQAMYTLLAELGPPEE